MKPTNRLLLYNLAIMLLLPNEMLLEILEYLDIPTVKSVRLVCVRLREVGLSAVRYKVHVIPLKLKDAISRGLCRDDILEMIVWQTDNCLYDIHATIRFLKLTCYYNILNCFVCLYDSLIEKWWEFIKETEAEYEHPKKCISMRYGKDRRYGLHTHGRLYRFRLLRVGMMAYCLNRNYMFNKIFRLFDDVDYIRGWILLYYLDKGYRNSVMLLRIIYEDEGYYKLRVSETKVRSLIHKKDLVEDMKILVNVGTITKEMYHTNFFYGPYGRSVKWKKSYRYHANTGCNRYACKLFDLTPIYIGYSTEYKYRWSNEVRNVYISIDSIPAGRYNNIPDSPKNPCILREAEERLVPLHHKYIVVITNDYIRYEDYSDVWVAIDQIDFIEEHSHKFLEGTYNTKVYIVDVELLKRRRKVVFNNLQKIRDDVYVVL